MARPQVLCKLEKGKVIDAQSGFVDTFNWMVDFINNLIGEGEEIAGKSDLRVDRTVDDHPVIRGGGKYGGGGGSEAVPKPFDIENGIVVRCSIPCPVDEISAPPYAISGDRPVYLHVTRSASGYAATVDQTSRAESSTHVQFKLYELANGKPTLDCRPMVLPLFAF